MNGPSPREEGTENRTLRTDLGPFSMVPLWVHRYNLGSGQLAIYCVLARFAMMGVAFPSVKVIMEESHKSRTQVYEALRGLELKGLLSRHPRHDQNGRQMSNEYVLAMAADPFPEPEQLSLDAQMEGGCGFPEGIPELSGNPDEPEGGGCGFPTGGRVRVSDTPLLEEEGVEGEEATASSAPRIPIGHKDYVAALVAAVGGGRPLSDNRMGQVVKAAQQLRGMGADPALMETAWKEGLSRFNGKLTPIGLADNWWTLSGATDNGSLLDRLQAIERQRSAS